MLSILGPLGYRFFGLPRRYLHMRLLPVRGARCPQHEVLAVHERSAFLASAERFATSS